MNTTTEQPTNQLAVIDKKIKPPMSRHQLLQATALAMHKDMQAKQTAYYETTNKLNEQRNSILEKVARKLIRDAAVQVNSWTGKFRVSFEVTIPNDLVPQEAKDIETKLAAMKCPRLESVSEILQRLKSGLPANDRIAALVSDPQMAKQLVAAGNAILTAAKPSITA